MAIEPVSSNLVTRVESLPTLAPPQRAAAPPAEQGFAATLRRQLEQVSQMQNEAETGVQNLLTGRTQNITEVLAAARKAEVAFGLLMEIRNKLTEAYTELKRMPV